MSFYWYLLMTLMSTLEKYKKTHILSTLFADTETHVKNTDY